MYRVRLICVLVLSSLLLGACGPADVEPVTPESTGVTVTDALGRTVTFDQRPERIVVTGRANFFIMDALYMFDGASEMLAARPTSGQTQVDPFLALLDPAYVALPSIEHEASAEQVAAFQPDVVILKGFLADSIGAAIEALDIPVVYLDLETPEQYTRDLNILGQLLGQEARAQAILDAYQARQARVVQATAGLAADERPRVLLLQYSSRGGEIAFNVPPAAWIQTLLVEQAGGAPVWTEASEEGGWVVVNFEQIAAWNPDQVFVIDYFSNVDETVAGLAADPQWQALPAVQQGQLYAFPKDFYSWDQPDTRWILGLTWLATRIQPQLFADVDATEEAVAFYTQLYGMDDAAVREQILPYLQGTLD
ncbi:MAG: ABC transporter substrate-binding protein [Anaerolineae bacterium]|nr:ABC transporter substrate-binding protein [Anaerolineae bacterium]